MKTNLFKDEEQRDVASNDFLRPDTSKHFTTELQETH